jgi:hypothetical protein
MGMNPTYVCGNIWKLVMIAYWKTLPHLPERSDENRTRNCKAGGGDQCPCEVLDLHDLG